MHRLPSPGVVTDMEKNVAEEQRTEANWLLSICESKLLHAESQSRTRMICRDARIRTSEVGFFWVEICDVMI